MEEGGRSGEGNETWFPRDRGWLQDLSTITRRPLSTPAQGLVLRGLESWLGGQAGPGSWFVFFSPLGLDQAVPGSRGRNRAGCLG